MLTELILQPELSFNSLQAQIYIKILKIINKRDSDSSKNYVKVDHQDKNIKKS